MSSFWEVPVATRVIAELDKRACRSDPLHLCCTVDKMLSCSLFPVLRTTRKADPCYLLWIMHWAREKTSTGSKCESSKIPLLSHGKLVLNSLDMKISRYSWGQESDCRNLTLSPLAWMRWQSCHHGDKRPSSVTGLLPVYTTASSHTHGPWVSTQTQVYLWCFGRW